MSDETFISVQNNMKKQFKGIDFNDISGINVAAYGIAGLHNSIGERFRGIDFSAITATNTATYGIAAKIAELQNTVGKQFREIDFNAITRINTATYGIAAKISELQNSVGKRSRGIDFNAITGINTAAYGIAAKMTEMQNNITKQFTGINYNSILGINTAILSLNETMMELQNNFRKQFDEKDLSNIRFNENGTISYLNETVDINDTLDEISSCVYGDLNVEQKISNIFGNIKLKHPLVVFVVLYLVLSPLSAYYDDLVKSKITATVQVIQNKHIAGKDKNKIMKDIKSVVSHELNTNSSDNTNIKSTLSDYRFVKVDCLNVRIINSSDSKVLFTLQFGQVVKILDKNKEWVLIEYSDDKNICIKGWVFSKYISTFK